MLVEKAEFQLYVTKNTSIRSKMGTRNSWKYPLTIINKFTSSFNHIYSKLYVNVKNCSTPSAFLRREPVHFGFDTVLYCLL